MPKEIETYAGNGRGRKEGNRYGKGGEVSEKGSSICIDSHHKWYNKRDLINIKHSRDKSNGTKKTGRALGEKERKRKKEAKVN